jgi:hypothetical protein
MDDASSRRLLIATGTVAAGVAQLPALVRELIESASDILVIAPILPGRLEWLVSDTDRARYEADERLESVLGHVEAVASEARVMGAIGDETPLTAFADAIRTFRPNHILIALRAADHDAWQERNLVDRIRGNFGIPITVFELDRTGHAP